ncbi:MAG: hydrogenase maturation protease, partial [Acidobacteria bacterium]
RTLSGQMTTRETSGDGMELMELWRGRERVILIDAVQSGARPGTVHRWEVHHEPLPGRWFAHSTHALSVAEAIEIARALGELPSWFVVYGIEGRRFDVGAELSSPVRRAIPELLRRIERDLRHLCGPKRRN